MFCTEVAVRCVMTLDSGERCPLTALPGSQTCGAHPAAAHPGSFYTDQLTAEDQRALAAAAELTGVDAEIAVLRVLIRRVLTLGDVELARRGIETLCRTLKIRHALDEGTSSQLADMLTRVLDTIAEDEAVGQ
jgi:hypothetical protein